MTPIGLPSSPSRMQRRSSTTSRGALRPRVPAIVDSPFVTSRHS